MKDVAKLAGVSVSTVSRVINNNIPVDEQTRKRVENAIRTINYRPNLLAKGLRSKSGHLIGLVVPEIRQSAFTSFIQYTEASVTQRGFDLIIGNTHNDAEVEERFIDSLLRRNIDGIIFSRVSDRSRVLHVLGRSNTPLVVMDRTIGDEELPTVILDNYLAGSLAAEHLAELGHTKIACVTGPIEVALFRERLRGFRETLSAHGVTLEEAAVFEGDPRFDTGKQAVEYFLGRRLEFTALWCEADLMAIGAMEQLKRNNIDIPEQVSIVGIDDMELSEIVCPSLTTVAQPFDEMCDVAVQMIIDQKDGLEIAAKKVVLKPNLIVRNSTRRLQK